MYEMNRFDSRGGNYLGVHVPSFTKEHLVNAQEIALKSGYDPYRPGRMTDQGGSIKYYTFTRDGIKLLFNGKTYYKIYAANDANGNKVAKIFYMDNTTEIIKDPRLPISVDKFYASLSGLRRSK